MTLATSEIILRIVLAAVFGALIGWGREARGRAAGLRTYMMVAIGSAGITLVAVRWITMAEANASLAVDGTRIIQAVIGGIGFLGAGTIIQTRGQVTGITTAAGLWVTAAIGIAIGCGFYAIAIPLIVATWLTLEIIRRVESYTFDGDDVGDDKHAAEPDDDRES